MFTRAQALFFLSTNLALTLIVGVGIFSFTQNIFWAILGSLIITGAASATPLFAFVAYPAIEYFFNDGTLTIYSALSVGINAIQLLVAMYISSKKSRDT